VQTFSCTFFSCDIAQRTLDLVGGVRAKLLKLPSPRGLEKRENASVPRIGALAGNS
jgi:hypothetical protein